MTGVVLALAGLACGDGEPNCRAARGPVTVRVSFEEGFRGYIRLPGGRPCEVFLGGYTRTFVCIRCDHATCTFIDSALVEDGPGKFRLTYSECVFAGTISSYGRGVLLTLNPVPLKGDPRLGGSDIPVTIRRVASTGEP